MNTSNNTNITPVPFSWGEISLSQTVQINGIPHVTRRAVGEWLEYAEPRKAIDKIIERNQHLENYATTVRLTALDDKNREISVYHPIGFLLLVMESGQPKAQAMKVAVAEFVWHFMRAPELTFKEQMELIKHQRLIVSDLTKTKDAFARELLIDSLQDICSRLGKNMPDIAYLGKDARQIPLHGM